MPRHDLTRGPLTLSVSGERPGARLLTWKTQGVREMAGGSYEFEDGDRMLIPCDGGPCMSRLETFPPPLEIIEHGGIYVLVDDGLPRDWRYQFVPTSVD